MNYSNITSSGQGYFSSESWYYRARPSWFTSADGSEKQDNNTNFLRHPSVMLSNGTSSWGNWSESVQDGRTMSNEWYIAFRYNLSGEEISPLPRGTITSIRIPITLNNFMVTERNSYSFEGFLLYDDPRQYSPNDVCNHMIARGYGTVYGSIFVTINGGEIAEYGARDSSLEFQYGMSSRDCFYIVLHATGSRLQLYNNYSGSYNGGFTNAFAPGVGMVLERETYSYSVQNGNINALQLNERLTIKLYGKYLPGMSLHVIYKYGNTILEEQELCSGNDSYEVSTIQPLRSWYINTNAPPNQPMRIDVYIYDDDGDYNAYNWGFGPYTENGVAEGVQLPYHLTTAYVKLAPLGLRGSTYPVVGNLQSIKTGESIVFNLEHREPTAFNLNGELGINEDIMEPVTFKMLYSGRIIMELKNQDTDVFQFRPDSSWFDNMNVTGSKTMTITANVKDALGRSESWTFVLNAGPEMEPVLGQPTVTIVQAEAAAAYPDLYISGYSKAKISASVSRSTLAPIERAILSYPGGSFVMSYNIYNGCYEYITPRPLESDTVFHVIIVDSRGFQKSGSVTVTGVIDYSPPSFNLEVLYRCDENGFENIGGTYYRVRAVGSYDTDLPGNKLQLFTVGVKDGEVHDIESGETYIFPSGFDYGKRLTICVAVRDNLSSEITAEWVLVGGTSIIRAYNNLVDKYSIFNEELQTIDEVIVGFPALMRAYYNTVDMEMFLRSELMPNVSVSLTTAAIEAARLTADAISPVAVTNLNSCSSTTAANAVLNIAKCIVRSGYQVKIKESSYDQTTHQWTGSFIVTNYDDDDDVAVSDTIAVAVGSDMETFIKQKIAIAMNKESDDVTDIADLFALGIDEFEQELTKYSMQRLIAFREACQACADIVMQTGASSVSQVQNLVKYNVSGQSGSGAAIYVPNTNVTINGVLCSIDSSGVITLNGTATEDFQFYFADEMDEYVLNRGYYTYSLNSSDHGVGALFGEIKKAPNSYGIKEPVLQYSVFKEDDYSNGTFRVPVEGAGETRNDAIYTGQVVFGFSVSAGTTFNGLQIKPMLERGTIKHGWISPSVGNSVNNNLSQNDALYYNIYYPYMAKLESIEKEILVRERELEVVVGKYDSNGSLVTDGAQTLILKEKELIQSALDFEAYLGEELWEEFASYRREDNLSNPNYISDGLNNYELFQSAEEFFHVAQREINKSAEAQHSIEGDLHNLLTMEEFQPLTDSFSVGNWIKVGVDGVVYKLRLYSYEIDFDKMSFDVEFTSVQKGVDTASDVSDLLGKVRTISASYGAVARQASSGKASKALLDEWNESGVPPSAKIISGSGVQEFILDQNGLSGKEYFNDTDMYSPAQVKFSSNGLYATTDAWQTGKTVVGMYSYLDPNTRQSVEGFGSIAELLIGSMILNDSAKIFSDDGSVLINKDGITTNDMYVNRNLLVRGTKNRIAETDDYGDRLMYSYETASPLFGDIGEGVIGDNGSCTVQLDPVFAETVSTKKYQVFLQCYGDGSAFVSERDGEFFVVRGTPGLCFGWEIKASQSGYENTRLEAVDIRGAVK